MTTATATLPMTTATETAETATAILAEMTGLMTAFQATVEAIGQVDDGSKGAVRCLADGMAELMKAAAKRIAE